MLGVSPPFAAYAGAYAAAALGCAVALRRAARIEDPDTRRGLVALVGASGAWAVIELGVLAAPTPALQYGAYLGSLVVGLTTIGAWLYFCSAYTGRSFHRSPAYRRAAAGAYLAIVALKLTNPVHGLYFTAEVVREPFVHLTFRHGVVHWVVAGLSYALVAVGLFMLYELFLEADYDTRPLAALAGVTAAPVLLDLVGFVGPLLDVNYEPIGVAVFALGALYVYDEAFLAVQLTDGVDDPVVYLDADGRIREFNGRAADLFSLAGAAGEPLAEALPAVADVLGADDPVLERGEGGETRYYLVSDTAFSIGQTDIGRMVVFTDVTGAERRRRELERQNEQLEGLAAAIRHELLNALNLLQGHVSVAGDALDDGDVAAARESLRAASDVGDRMASIVEGLGEAARHGRTLERTEWVDLRRAAETAWRGIEADGAALSVDGGEVEADPDRLADLLGSAFAFAVHSGASAVTVTPRRDGFVVGIDSPPPDGADPDSLFEYGAALPDADAGVTLPNVRTLARVHGWTVTGETAPDDGFRLVVSDARVRAEPVAT